MNAIGGRIVDNRVPVWLGAVVGAVAGAIGGYLYFTEPGRRLRADIEPRIGDLAREVARARDAATRAAGPERTH